MSDSPKNTTVYIICLGITFCSLLFVFFASMRSGTTPSAKENAVNVSADPETGAEVLSLLRDGLQLDAETPQDNQDVGQYAEMLINNSLRQFVNYPEMAAEIWTPLAVSLPKMNPESQRSRVEQYLQSLDEGLLRCTDQAVLRNAWNIRRIAVKTLENIPQKTVTSLPETVSVNEPNLVLTAVEKLQKTAESTLEMIASFQKTQQDALHSIEPTPSATQIAEMFREGLREASEAGNDDEDAISFAAAMIENAMENVTRCPQAVSVMWKIQAEHIQKSEEPQLRLVQLALFLEYLDRAMRNCHTPAAMKEIWAVRKAVVEQHDMIQNELIAAAKSKLGEIASEIVKINTDIQAEKTRDMNQEAGFYQPEKADDTKWQDGGYQKILQRIVAVQERLNASEVSDWLDSTEDTLYAALPTKLTELLQETLRLQQLRYNLWANYRIAQARSGEPNTNMVNLSQIDTGILVPTIYTLYSEVEQQNSTEIKNVAQRTETIRRVLLSAKIPLQAF